MTVAPAPGDSVEIAADGASSVEVHVYVYDQFSNPVRAGTIVRFETTLGTITPSNFTDLSGHCSALLTAGTITGNAVISIHVGDIIGFTQIKLTQLLADDIVLTITPIQLTPMV
jgi:hypothetical protein